MDPVNTVVVNAGVVNIGAVYAGVAGEQGKPTDWPMIRPFYCCLLDAETTCSLAQDRKPMKRNLLSRPLVAGLLTIGLLGSGAAAAVASETPQPRGPHDARTLPADVPQAQVNSAQVDEIAVQRWQEFRVTGVTENVPAGYTVLLQQKQDGVWRTLPATTQVRQDGTYSMRVRLGVTGVNELRTVTGDYGTLVSEPMQVLVR